MSAKLFQGKSVPKVLLFGPITEEHSKFSQTHKMDFFAKIVNG